MNAHALPAGERQVTHGEPPEGERGVRGLVWVTWRQHRAALAGVAGLLGAFALAMVVQGVGMHAAFNDLGLGGARSFDTPRLASLAQTFENEYLSFGLYVPRVLMFLPLFVGAFLGAPLLAREYETGTFRFAWTQGVGRTRWIAAKLALLGLALAIVSLAFSLLFGWWYQPFARLMGHQPEVEGLVFTARVLFGFAAGALIGRLVRHTVPAIATTMAVWFAVILPVALFVRPHIQAPLVGRVDAAAKFSTEWTLSQWWVDPHGHRLGQAAFNAIARAHASDPSGWLTRHGYVLWESYQPVGRFWTFQVVEAGALVALAVVLAGLTVWLVRRRAT